MKRLIRVVIEAVLGRHLLFMILTVSTFIALGCGETLDDCIDNCISANESCLENTNTLAGSNICGQRQNTCRDDCLSGFAKLTKFQIEMESDLDLQCLFAVDENIRPAIQELKMKMTIAGDETLRKIANLGYTYSSVSNSVSKGVNAVPEVLVVLN